MFDVEVGDDGGDGEMRMVDGKDGGEKEGYGLRRGEDWVVRLSARQADDQVLCWKG